MTCLFPWHPTPQSIRTRLGLDKDKYDFAEADDEDDDSEKKGGGEVVIVAEKKAKGIAEEKIASESLVTDKDKPLLQQENNTQDAD